MKNRIPLARPAVSAGELAAAERALASTRLTSGPETARFESSLAARCARRHAVAVSSGTAAIELALWALDIAPGDRILVAGFGFPAAANAVARRGALPIAADVDADTWNVDLERARQLVDERTRALITIDQLGLVTESDEIERFAADTGLPVLSDAACGLGGTDSTGRPAGAAGRVATLSFHPRKTITTGEGGALVTDDPVLEERVRALRNHGQVGAGVFTSVGTNARLSEIAAAIGSAQLTRLDTMQTERSLLANGYLERLADLRDRGALEVQKVPDGARHAYQTFAVQLNPRYRRADVIERLADAGIESSPATYAFSRVGTHPGSGAAPVAEALHDQALAIPLFVGMRSAELDQICAALTEVLQ